MPELPEVETIRRDIEKDLLGLTIESVDVLYTRSINLEEGQYRKKTEGFKLTRFLRNGKLLQIQLSSGDWLLIHLKMTGQLIVRNSNGHMSGGGHPTELTTLPTKHTRIIFHLSGGTVLFFNDIRTFGWVYVVDDQARQQYLARLAPDALLEDITSVRISDYCKKHPNINIKQMLLDQSRFAAGLGNIYADEVCYRSKILPSRKAGTLTDVERSNISKNIRDILALAVENRGTSFRNFVDGDGKKGGFQELLQVYGRGGQPCNSCGEELKKGVVAQRGTVWCDKCQI